MRKAMYLLEGVVILGVLLIGLLLGMAWTALNNNSLVQGPQPNQSAIQRVAHDNK